MSVRSVKPSKMALQKELQMVGPIGGANNSLFGLKKANNLLQNTINKISSGSRIPFAAADAAGLTISEKFRGQIRGFNKASNNIQDGISLLRTAEGGLSNTSDDLLRLRELAVQAGNGALADEDRAALEQEARQIIEGLDDTAQRTEFNTKNLLDGSTSGTVSSGSSGFESYITGDLTQSGSFRGSVSSSVDAQGNRVLELSLAGGGQSNSVTLDENFRASGALAGVDLQFEEISSAETEGGQGDFEDVVTFEDAATVTVTDSGGDAATVNFAAGNASLEDVVSQLNTDFAANNVDVTAVLEDGDINIRANQANANFTVSGTDADIQQALGINDGNVTAAAGENAELEGTTNEAYVSEGVDFSSQVSFTVSDGSRAATQVDIGGANQTLTRAEILESVNTQLAAGGQDVTASFDDAGALIFESADVGSSASVEVKDVSGGAETLRSSLGVRDQTARGSGTTEFTLNVSRNGLNFQTGANQGQGSNFAFGGFSSGALNLSSLDFQSAEGRDSFLGRVDSAINRVSSARSSIGAQENAFRSNFNSVQQSNINANRTESLIRDVDIAKQAVELSRQQSLLNTAIFAQSQTINLNRTFLGSLIS